MDGGVRIYWGNTLELGWVVPRDFLLGVEEEGS